MAEGVQVYFQSCHLTLIFSEKIYLDCQALFPLKIVFFFFFFKNIICNYFVERQHFSSDSELIGMFQQIRDSLSIDTACFVCFITVLLGIFVIVVFCLVSYVICFVYFFLFFFFLPDIIF